MLSIPANTFGRLRLTKRSRQTIGICVISGPGDPKYQKFGGELCEIYNSILDATNDVSEKPNVARQTLATRLADSHDLDRVSAGMHGSDATITLNVLTMCFSMSRLARIPRDIPSADHYQAPNRQHLHLVRGTLSLQALA